ncbi:MAG: 3'-phosphoesterase [Candidatus Aenigmarchaeota archaeon]|nr:3'-phosphoesterase [Candidatus Aenigmarchaeota archaeon]
MPLEKYNKLRNFSKTNEPKGEVKKGTGSVYAIQEHRSSHLHYDLRLEIGGVLRSWAIPKEPSTDPKTKRLAVETEDHPVDYASFEGKIPEGEYGAGEVKSWDSGTFEIIDRKEDKLILEIHGKRLKGKFVLIRTKFGGDPKNWLFFKKKEEE